MFCRDHVAFSVSPPIIIFLHELGAIPCLDYFNMNNNKKEEVTRSLFLGIFVFTVVNTWHAASGS